jgi:bis(5'-nucleosyl)-tetraphosphatase (symmetrical)
MATWVIGDIHGCWETLQRLLERIEWVSERDELWLVGDLVNRGPSSLEVLRWAREHSERLVAVLGNHDLHLLARAAGVAEAKEEDTLDEILAAPDRDELLGWLRARPLVHRFGPSVMVHGGLMPEWNIELTCGLADEVAVRLSGPDDKGFMEMLFGNRNTAWRPELDGDERLAAAAAIFTRLRMIGSDGQARLAFNGSPDDAPKGWRPWFATSAVLHQGYALLFGHWAQLGFHRVRDFACLDSGCVYGGSLTALRLTDGRVVHEPVADPIVAPDELADYDPGC